MDGGRRKEMFVPANDRLQCLEIESPPSYMHERHRWVLPIVAHHQEIGKLPKPCTLIMFDAHHDAKELSPEKIKEIQKIRTSGPSPEKVSKLCSSFLSELNDDWVRAGMELGFYDDAVIFGTDSNLHLGNFEKLASFSDHMGTPHRLEIPNLPGRALEYQGSLSDISVREKFEPLWKTLGWESEGGKVFQFKSEEIRFHLDIDLDCFAIRWQEYIFPWLEEVWSEEFLKTSDYFTTEGWTGKKFFEAILQRAGLLTIAREPSFCGGDEKAKRILHDLDRFLFDGGLSN